MNRILIYICAFLIVSCTNTKTTSTTSGLMSSTTKLDRSQPPKAGPAPEIKIGDYKHFELENGLKVYVVQNDKLPRVAFSLRIDRDPIIEGDKSGYSSITGSLLSRGTSTKSKADLDEATDYIGASFFTSSSVMYGASLTKHRDELLGIMQDVLLNPTFPQEELEKLKKLQISNLISAKDDPGEIISNIRGLVVYGEDHPYGELVNEKTIENISREDVVNFYQNYWTPKGAHLAIVGDISVDEAEALTKKYFGNWKGENLPKHSYEQPAEPKENTVVLVDRPQSVQSEIRISYPINLKKGDKDIFAVSLMNQIFGSGASSRLHLNLREDKGYTYSVGSGFSTDKVIGRFTAGGSVRNEVTDSAIHEILLEMESIVNNGVTEEELTAVKAYMTGSFARSLESPQTIAGFAINTAINDLDEDFYSDYLKRLDAVTVEDVNAAAKKFIKYDNAYIIVVGKADDIEDKLKKFGPIKYYDVDGNQYDPAEMNKMPEGTDAQSVINNYINALGGRAKLNSVVNVKKEWSLDMQGRSLKIVEVQTANGMFREDIIADGVSVQQIVSNGKSIAMSAGGRIQPMEEEEKSAQIISHKLFPELNYKNAGARFRLEGKEIINGESAYHIKVMYTSGQEFNVYFDEKSGFKVKETTMIKTPMGEMMQSTTFDNYKIVDGINFAHSETTSVGPQTYTVTLQNVEKNTKTPPDYFKVSK